MDKVYLTSEFTFDAAHRLHYYEGKCKQTHGHTYRLQVTVCGVLNPLDGLLMDFVVLKNLVEEKIIEVVDHKDLSEVFKMNTTVENLCVWTWNALSPWLPNGVELHKIRLWETPTCYATYRGGG